MCVEQHAAKFVSRAPAREDGNSMKFNRSGLNSFRKLFRLIEARDEDGAEAHWRAHMQVVGRVMLGQQAKTVVDLLDEF